MLLNTLVGAWGVMAAAGAGYTGFKYLWPSQDMGKEEGDAKLNIPVTDLPQGGMVKVKYKGGPIGIIESKGNYFAVSLVCTHLGCIVNLDSRSSNLFCPCHASEFDIHGNVLAGPAPKPLQTYPVQVSEGKIIVG